MAESIRRTGLFRKRAAALFSALALVVTVQVAVAPAASAAACSDVVAIGVRGTNEPAGFGTMVGDVVAKLKPRLSKWDGYIPLVYPASANYWKSLEAGKTALRAQLRGAAKACPATKFLLIGYSQGAHVVGDVVVEFGNFGGKIAGVGLLGDPMFKQGGSGSIGVGGSTTLAGGVFGRRSSLPTALKGKIVNLCLKGDSICDTRTILGIVGLPNSANPHHKYKTTGYGGYVSTTAYLAYALDRLV